MSCEYCVYTVLWMNSFTEKQFKYNGVPQLKLTSPRYALSMSLSIKQPLRLPASINDWIYFDTQPSMHKSSTVYIRYCVHCTHKPLSSSALFFFSSTVFVNIGCFLSIQRYSTKSFLVREKQLKSQNIFFQFLQKYPCLLRKPNYLCLPKKCSSGHSFQHKFIIYPLSDL